MDAKPVRKFTPSYPRLLAEKGPRCSHLGNRVGAGFRLQCARRQGHEGRHIHDIPPGRIK